MISMSASCSRPRRGGRVRAEHTACATVGTTATRHRIPGDRRARGERLPRGGGRPAPAGAGHGRPDSVGSLPPRPQPCAGPGRYAGPSRAPRQRAELGATPRERLDEEPTQDTNSSPPRVTVPVERAVTSARQTARSVSWLTEFSDSRSWQKRPMSPTVTWEKSADEGRHRRGPGWRTCAGRTGPGRCELEPPRIEIPSPQLTELLKRHAELPQYLEKERRADRLATVNRDRHRAPIRVIPALVTPGLATLRESQLAATR